MRIFGLAFAVFMLMLRSPLLCRRIKRHRKITVSGKAENTVEAQRAEISLSVKLVKKEMSQSHAALTGELSKLSKELNAIGIPDKDIKRSLVLQGAEYNWEKESNVLKGYYAECHVDVTVNDITKMADVYWTLAAHKNISIQSTFQTQRRFDLKKRSTRRRSLLQEKGEFMARRSRQMGSYSIRKWTGKLGWQTVCGKFQGKEESSGGQSSYGSIKIIARVMVEFELE
jgi:hypothetical protein